MAWYRIAQSTDYSEQIEIWEEADADPGLDYNLILQDVIEKQGAKDEDLFRPHLPYELQTPVIDVNNTIYNRLRDSANTKHKIRKKDPSTGDIIYEGYLNKDFEPHPYARNYTILPLIGYDGITTLQAKKIDFNIGHYWQWGTLFEKLIHGTGITLDVVIATTLQHTGASGQNGIIPNQHRSRPVFFLEKNDEHTYYDLLTAMLSFFKMQLFQEDGQWLVMERYPRSGATIDYYNITQDSQSSVDPNITMPASVARKEPNEINKKPVSSVLRTATYRDGQYNFENMRFEKLEEDAAGNIKAVPAWIATNPDALSIYGSDFERGGLEANPEEFELLQMPDYPLSEATLHFYLNVEFDLNEPDNSAVIDYAQVYAAREDGTIFGARDDGTWEEGFDGIYWEGIVSGGGNKTVSQNIDVQMDPLPFSSFSEGVLVFRLYLLGDLEWINGTVKYIKAGMELVDNYDILRKERIYSYSNQGIGDSIEETVYQGEQNGTRADGMRPISTIQYYDGTSWVDATGEWPTETLNYVITDRLAKQRISLSNIATVPCDANFDVSMQDTVSYTIKGQSRKYLPIFIQRNRKGKAQQVKLAQINDEPTNPVQVTYQDY